MAVLKPPRGLIVDLITPFDTDGSIDGRGLGKQLDRVIPHSQGVFLSGPKAGEGTNLTLIQRQEILDRSMAVIQGQVPILIWITQRTEE